MKRTKLKWSEMNKKQRILFVIDWVLRGLLIFIFALLVGAFVFSCFGNSSETASAYADDGSSEVLTYNINPFYHVNEIVVDGGVTILYNNGTVHISGTATSAVVVPLVDSGDYGSVSDTTYCVFNDKRVDPHLSLNLYFGDSLSRSWNGYASNWVLYVPDSSSGSVNRLVAFLEIGYTYDIILKPMMITGQYNYVNYPPFQPNLTYFLNDFSGGGGGSGSDGYDQGYSDGYEAGTTAGYDQGYEEGYTDGINSASGSGDYDDGFTDGYNTANSFIPLYNFSSCELTLLNSTTQQTSSDPYTFINSSYVNGSLDNQISFRLTFPSYLSPNIMFTIRWKNPLAYYDNGSIDIEIAPNINLSFYNDSNLLGNVALDWVRSDVNGVVYYSVDRKFSSGVTSVVISMQASSLSFDDFEVGYKGEYTYDVGYQSGFDKGQSLGYENGYNVGHSLGYQEGFDSSGAGGFSWLISSVQSFLDTKFFGDFGIGTLLYVGLGIALCSLFIKFFAGG